MAGSVAIAAVIAWLTLPVLVIVGWLRGELGPRGVLLFAMLGLIAWIGLPRLFPRGGDFVTTTLAILDIVLVFVVIKGDVRLS